ncbi:hypothetical protein HB662_00465 [Roseomonas frigidaquae]|uniref:Common-antigen outer membrane protein n=1 Tax=Falsiroseomonas frigidaquae TaxID=487318 RepID=A0ABX1ERT5_9PROT|nr:DVU3141 family protein [Falsiroseomonas frigidaquae]NKE43230.1 hypothetical protein [Falsiroseomonas frigidaquae]
MMHCTQVPAKPAAFSNAPVLLRATVVLLGLVALTGCARLGAEGLGSRATPVASAPASSDPLVVWAGQAQPGAVDRVTLANGQTAQVRLVRAYYAASGRECREMLVGAGMVERSRLVCAVPGGWVEARSLLRGGGAARP